MKQRRPLQLVFVLLGHLLILLQRSAECSNQLRHSQANKQFIDQLREGHYEIVHPFQLRDKSRERMSIDTREQFLNSTPAQHFRRVSFVVRSSVLVHQRLRLTLALNEHLLATARDELDENGGVKRVDVGENCFYQGSMIGEPESFVALSTCQGLWGLLLFANGTALGIWPLKGGDQGRRHPHILFRVNTAKETGCGTTSRERHRQRREKQGGEGMAAAAGRQRKERLFLELALLIDDEMMSQFNTSLPKAFEYSLNALNLADLLLRRGLNLRLAVNFAQVWADDAQPRPNGHQMLISRLLDYVSGHLYGQEKDATLLLTGNRFSSSNHTMAAVEASVCSSRAVGFVQVLDPFAPHQTGLRLAHSIGHMLGLDHDTPDCGCSTAAAADGSAPAAPCVMAEPFGPSPLFPVHFSPCSSGRLLSQRLGHHLRCLADRPRLLASDRAAAFLCGNGQIDAGEECDCGRRDQCRDPCCDPLSCQLRPHAQCAGHQPCCQGCQLRPVGLPCRSAQSVCDVPESCDGASGDCPVDGHLLDGTSCGIGGNGQCWQGQCRDPEAQCRLLWGQGASLADELCFGQNGRALEYGNCGRDADGAFVECAPENERCGLLHCRDGAASPSGHLPANATSFALQFAGKGSRLVQCKVVTNSALGLVQDGTGCGPGRVCLQAVCLPLAEVSPPVQCPSAPGHQQMPCSGHGDCTTSRQCLCFDGWAGSACELRAAGKRKEPSLGRQPPELMATSFGPGSRFGNRALLMETATLLAILLLVGVLLLLLLVCLLLFYRRKSSGDSSRGRRPQVKASSADEEDLPVDGEEAEEAGGRAIKFGQMPSWREEKRKWKTNKRVYDALQRITEANEADSLSLKSRESSVAANNSLLHHGQPQQLLHSSASLADNRRPEVSSPPHSLRHSPAPSSLHGAGGTASAMYIAENYFLHNSADESAEAGLMLLGMGTMDRREHQGQQQQTSMADGMASTASFGPRLANISLLMQKLDTFEGEEASNRAGALRAPDSTDSGNAGSSQDVRESPSLFSDPYRLDLPG